MKGSSALLLWQELVPFRYESISSMAVRVRLFLNSAAMSERPLVCVWSLSTWAFAPAP